MLDSRPAGELHPVSIGWRRIAARGPAKPAARRDGLPHPLAGVAAVSGFPTRGWAGRTGTLRRNAGVTIKALDQMSSLYGGFFVRLRAELGVTSFGIQVYRYPPGARFLPPHDHAGTGGPDDRQEEVYTVLMGRARLLAGGESFELTPGVFALVKPDELRQVVTDQEPATVLVIGGTPGALYAPPPLTELGVTEEEIDFHRKTGPP
jgi:quercetin dioxygenase-like cupin family protein